MRTESFLSALILGTAIGIFGLFSFIALFDGADDMAKCQREFSYEVCAHTLK